MANNEVVIHVKATDDASAKLAAVEGKARGLGGVLGTALKAGAIGGAAALAGVGVASINLAADFQSTMSSVGAVSQATAEEMKGLSKEALNIGKDTKFSAGQSAAAMEILAANGISARDIMGGAARAATTLAAAGGTDLKMAADAASTSMAVWGLKTADLTDVVNRLAGAANVSRFGVEDMAMAVAMGGGAAASAGVEFGDFATAIAAIAPSFSSGSDAGTSFKQFLNGLTPTGNAAKDSMRELGLMTADGSNKFFDASGSLKSLADITALLNTATKDLSEQQKAQALETIFGSDAMRAAAAISKLTGKEFALMSDTMKNTDAQEIAKMRMDNFKGSMEQLKGAIETIMITIGMELLPVLQQYADWLANVGIPGVQEWLAENKQTFEDIQQTVETVMGIVVPLLEGSLRHIANQFELYFNIIGGTFKAFKGLFTGDWELFLEGLRQTVTAPLEFIENEFRIAWDMVNTLTDGALNRVKDNVSAQLTSIVEFFELLPGRIAEGLGDLSSLLWQKGRDLIQGFVRGMTSVPIPNPLDMIPDLTPGFNVPGIPGFASGGIVPGRIGAPRLAVVHGGETITPPGRGGGGGAINFTINAIDARSVLDWLRRGGAELIGAEVERALGRRMV